MRKNTNSLENFKIFLDKYEKIPISLENLLRKNENYLHTYIKSLKSRINTGLVAIIYLHFTYILPTYYLHIFGGL